MMYIIKYLSESDIKIEIPTSI
ncbi:MAG: hypothetical protein RIQ33_1932, partial [Bacteroidota bacterium]